VLHFIDAEAKHTELLRDILIASKSYWGYSQEQLEQWRTNLKFEEKYVARNTVKLVMAESDLIGFFALVKGDIDEWIIFGYCQKPLAKVTEIWFLSRFSQNAKRWR
jgi:hypothetical protein